jgi:hypothetical protein
VAWNNIMLALQNFRLTWILNKCHAGDLEKMCRVYVIHCWWKLMIFPSSVLRIQMYSAQSDLFSHNLSALNQIFIIHFHANSYWNFVLPWKASSLSFNIQRQVNKKCRNILLNNLRWDKFPFSFYLICHKEQQLHMWLLVLFGILLIFPEPFCGQNSLKNAAIKQTFLLGSTKMLQLTQ